MLEDVVEQLLQVVSVDLDLAVTHAERYRFAKLRRDERSRPLLIRPLNVFIFMVQRLRRGDLLMEATIRGKRSLSDAPRFHHATVDFDFT